MKKLCVLALAVATLTGCETMYTADPYTGEKKLRKSVKYGAIGAASCTAASALINKDKKNKTEKNAAAAAACAAVGAGIGHYMDVQERKLRTALQNSGVQVVREGDNIRLIMPGQITFAVNRSDIQPNFVQTLNGIGVVLKEYNKTSISIAGHTDSTGQAPYNQALSEQRAASVANYLASQGIPATRIRHFGLGPSSPIASNSTATGRQQNRRVEIQLVPPAQL